MKKGTLLVRGSGPLSKAEREALATLLRRESARRSGARLPPGTPYPCSIPELGQGRGGEDYSGTVLGCRAARRPEVLVGRAVPLARVRRDATQQRVARARRVSRETAERLGPGAIEEGRAVRALPSQAPPVPPDALLLSHSAEEGTVVRGSRREDAPTIKAAGLRWFGRGGFWYVPRSRGASVSEQDLDTLAWKLQKTGRPVAVAGFEQVSTGEALQARGSLLAAQAERLKARAAEERARAMSAKEAQGEALVDLRRFGGSHWEKMTRLGGASQEAAHAEREAREAEAAAERLARQAAALSSDPLEGAPWADEIRSEVDRCLRNRERAASCRDDAFRRLPYTLTPAEERAAKVKVERYVAQRYLAAGKRVRVGIPKGAAQKMPSPESTLRRKLLEAQIPPALVRRIDDSGVNLDVRSASLPPEGTALAYAAKAVQAAEMRGASRMELDRLDKKQHEAFMALVERIR